MTINTAFANFFKAALHRLIAVFYKDLLLLPVRLNKQVNYSVLLIILEMKEKIITKE